MFIKKFTIFILRFYQKTIGVYKGNTCKFYPTCSEYAVEVIQKNGCFKGMYLSIRRISKCHPWRENSIDKPKGSYKL